MILYRDYIYIEKCMSDEKYEASNTSIECMFGYFWFQL